MQNPSDDVALLDSAEHHKRKPESEINNDRIKIRRVDEEGGNDLSLEEQWDINAAEIAKTWNQDIEELKREAHVFLEKFRATHKGEYCPSSVTELVVNSKPSLKKIKEEIEKHNEIYPQNQIKIDKIIDHINFDNMEKFSVPMR
jgi:hypothetical protein